MSTHEQIMGALVEMVTEVLEGDVLEPIEPATSFRDGLGFDSIRFIALAELLQNRYDEIDFVTWLQAKPIDRIMALTVGDVADFVTARARAGSGT